MLNTRLFMRVIVFPLPFQVMETYFFKLQKIFFLQLAVFLGPDLHHSQMSGCFHTPENNL